MDYRSAGLIMLSALTVWAQHRHDHFASAQLAPEAVEVRNQARLATQPLALDCNDDSAVVEESDEHFLSEPSALTRPLSVFRQRVAILLRTFDEVKEAGLLLGWQLLGDERPLRALLRTRRPQPVVCCGNA